MCTVLSLFDVNLVNLCLSVLELNQYCLNLFTPFWHLIRNTEKNCSKLAYKNVGSILRQYPIIWGAQIHMDGLIQ